MKIKRYIFLIFIFLLGFSCYPLNAESRKSLIIFYSPSCQECLKINNEFMPNIEGKYQDKINITYLDINEIHNYKLLLSYEERYDKAKKTLPIVFMEGRFLSGEARIKKQLEEVILNSLREKGGLLKETLPAVDLVSRLRSFSLLGIICAGLVDGFNPCAFTVIVFFISFLTFQKYRKRDILVTGLCFIFAVFLTYLLIGLGLFRILYSLRVFYFLSRLFYILIAALAFLLGIFTVYDILKFKATQKAEDMFLKLPERLKYYIHYIIGLKYRPTEKDVRGNNSTLRLVITALVVGSMVSVIELVCTGQLYLPTITFVLKISPLRLQALTYLIIYNIMFVIPLLLVFFFALAGMSSGEFSKFAQKHMILIKALMAVLFFGLGLILIWKV